MFFLLYAFILFGAVVGDESEEYNMLMMKTIVDSFTVLLKGFPIEFNYDFGPNVTYIEGKSEVEIYSPFKLLDKSSSTNTTDGFLLNFIIQMGDIFIRQVFPPDLVASGCQMELNYELTINFDDYNTTVNSLSFDNCHEIKYLNGSAPEQGQLILPHLAEAVLSVARSRFTFNATDDQRRWAWDLRWANLKDYHYYMFTGLQP